jgi:hypothetical protein
VGADETDTGNLHDVIAGSSLEIGRLEFDILKIEILTIEKLGIEMLHRLSACRGRYGVAAVVMEGGQHRGSAGGQGLNYD